MTPQTYIFIGRSGCGKGTQADLLRKVLAEKSSEIPITYMETGKLFRDFVMGQSYSQRLSKAINKEGGLQPEFLTIHLWSDFFVKNLTNNTHLITDGTPRKINEAKVLNTAFEFYKREKPHVIFINVSRAWSKERMLAREREDDKEVDIEARLDWYETEVVPTIDYYRNNPLYIFHDVNGERSIPEIHTDIVKMIGLV